MSYCPDIHWSPQMLPPAAGEYFGTARGDLLLWGQAKWGLEVEARADLWALQARRCYGMLQHFPHWLLTTCLWAQVEFAATPWRSQSEFGPEVMKLPWRQKLSLLIDHTLSSNRFLRVKSLFFSLLSQSFKVWRAFSQAGGREKGFWWRDSVDLGFIFKPRHEFSFWLCFSVHRLWSAKIFGKS